MSTSYKYVLKNKKLIKQGQQLLVIASVVSFCSLFFFNFLVDGFIITISVVALPILLYLYNDINAIKACAVVAIASPLFRMTILVASGLGQIEAFSIIFPEILFYLTYGLVFYIFYYKRQSLAYFPIAVYLSDFIGNLVEISLRTQLFGLNLEIIRGLAIVALVRTAIVFVSVFFIRYFHTFLVREEHEENYRRLLLLTSTFWSEIYFMEKNMIYIEDLMVKAYKLHKRTEELKSHEDIQRMSLDLSMGVHEVKKDYIRVIQGLQGVTEKKLYDVEMSMRDIAEVIELSTKKAISAEGKNIRLEFDIRSDTRVRYHFYMTSILRNLINNSIEAMDNQVFGKIKTLIYEADNKLVIIVEDNGAGIRESDLDYIFNSGFSSKYNETSGDVQRGLGLSIVKGFLETHFNGEIYVESTVDKGTQFKIEIELGILKGGN